MPGLEGLIKIQNKMRLHLIIRAGTMGTTSFNFVVKTK